jgi:oxygen-independent coproporphyrinogen-3 oxidase
MTTLTDVTTGSPYVSYAYGYPHKSAYRHFERPIPLAELWDAEQRDALFLYLHVPFCEYRMPSMAKACWNACRESPFRIRTC